MIILKPPMRGSGSSLILSALTIPMMKRTRHAISTISPTIPNRPPTLIRIPPMVSITFMIRA